MKKFLFAIVMLGIGTGLRSQTNSIGPTVGFNSARFSENSGARPSFNFGILYNYSIFENSGLGVELLYSQEGSITKIGNNNYTHELNYIRIPLEFNYYFGKINNDFRPKLFAGPSLAFLVGGESKSKFGSSEVTYNSKDLYKSFDIGLLLGVGFNYRLSDLIWFNFDAGYTHGLLNVSKGSNPELKNRLINLNFGIAYGF